MKKTTDFRALTLREAAAILGERVPTLVLFHKRPDADALGSALALRALLMALGSPAYCVCADEVPARLHFLLGDKQASVLAKSIPAGFENARVVSVDTASPAQLGDLFEQFGERVSLMIDHHGVGEPYADHLIVPDAAATGEIVLDLFEACGVALSRETATLLYTAISADTGSFRYSNTTKKTHLCAAKLMEMDVDVAAISRHLFEEKSYLQMQVEQEGFRHLSLHFEGKVAIIVFSRALRRSLGAAEEHLGTLIDVARSLAGVEVCAVMKETDRAGEYRVSLRANADCNVAQIAATFGGGGHVRAAGATLFADSEGEALQMLLDAITEGMC